MLVRGFLLMAKQRDFSGKQVCRWNLAVSPSLSYQEPTSIVTKKCFRKKSCLLQKKYATSGEKMLRTVEWLFDFPEPPLADQVLIP